MPKTGSRPQLPHNRRDFMKAGARDRALLARGALPRPARALPELPSNPATAGMPTATFGRTRLRVGVFQPRRAGGGRGGTTRPWPVPLVERALDSAQLHRHLLDLRRARALERALHRPGP